MTAVCADELLRDCERASAPGARREAAATASRRAPPPERPRPLRYEDFERRPDGPSEVLGGRLFPRLPLR